MTSKVTYPCYACKKAGYDVRVYLDKKGEDGKWLYLNEDMSPHIHNEQQSGGKSSSTNQAQPTKSQASTTIVTQATNESRILSKLQDLEQKIDHLTNLVYVQAQLLGQIKQWRQQQDPEQQK